MVNFFAALAVLRLRIGRVDGRAVATTAAKTVIASALMGAAVWAVAAAIGDGHRAVQVGVAISIGLVSFAVLTRILRIREFDEALEAVLRRSRGTEAEPAPAAGVSPRRPRLPR
jgi:hypothetical protein